MKAFLPPFASGSFFQVKKTFSEMALTLVLISSSSDSVSSFLAFFFGSLDFDRLTFFSSSSFSLLAIFLFFCFLSSFKGDFPPLGLAFFMAGLEEFSSSD